MVHVAVTDIRGWRLMDVEKGKKRKWLVPVIAIAVVLLLFASYQWIIPRTNLEIRTVYHESPGGGGTGGVININILLINKGNRRIDDLDCMVIVRETGGREVGRNNLESMDLSRGTNAEIKLNVIGSQYRGYRISIDLSFEEFRGRETVTLEHSTTEDQMNLVFVDNIR
jgi:hypothetical protein